MAMAPIRNSFLVLALALTVLFAAQDVARGDVQLEDLPRPMETSAAPFSQPPYSRTPLSQTPIDEQPILEEEVPGSILAPSLPGGHYGGAGYPPIGPAGSAPYSLPQGECYGDPWTWQLLPQGLIYHSYLAGPKEPRMASVLQHQT
ncbi:MAG TPA: hypothetical protein VGJ26_20510, partial [Pirellulales bacterium]